MTRALRRAGMLLMVMMATAGLSASAAPSPVTLHQETVVGVSVTYVAVNLNDPRVRVRVEVCRGFPGKDEPFDAMVQRLNPTAAMTGAYWSRATKIPIGDIVIDGKVVNRGHMGTALALTRQNQPRIGRVPWGRTVNWRGYETVLACGPALVLDGQVDVQPASEGFRDPTIMTTTARLAVGYTADNRLLLVQMSPVRFVREAEVMRALGCVGALNLDAGASEAVFYRGAFLTTPNRRLTNILCVYERR